MTEPESVYLTEKLSENELRDAVASGADIIICNEVTAVSAIPGNTTVINAEVYRVEGTWAAYGHNRKITDSLFVKKGRYFRIHGISLQRAAAKILFWSNHRTGSLKVAVQKLKGPVRIVRDRDYLEGNYKKELFKYFRNLVRNNIHFLKRRSRVVGIKGGYSTGILVNDGFELNLYRHILEKIKKEGVILFHYGNITSEELASIPSHIRLFDLSVTKGGAPNRPFNPFTLTKDELAAANLICEQWTQLSGETAAYHSMLTSGIDKLLVNVAENIPSRNLMKDVFGDRVTVYNTMNGMKSGEAQDADISFDKWFVWDTPMKQLLAAACGIPEEKMIISGHLSEDMISSHTYRGLRGPDPAVLRDKKVISLFSVRGKRKEKMEAFRLLYDLLEKDDSLFLIVRPHPLEKPSEYLLPVSNRDNVYFMTDEQKNKKETLYEQLLLSDLSIVFGSTVAMESKWMKVPCVTFEERERSFIYCAGEPGITHVRTIGELKNEILKVRKKIPFIPEGSSDVAGIIANELSQ